MPGKCFHRTQYCSFRAFLTMGMKLLQFSPHKVLLRTHWNYILVLADCNLNAFFKHSRLMTWRLTEPFHFSFFRIYHSCIIVDSSQIKKKEHSYSFFIVSPFYSFFFFKRYSNVGSYNTFLSLVHKMVAAPSADRSTNNDFTIVILNSVYHN